MVGRCEYGLDKILRLFLSLFPNFELSHVSVLNTIKYMHSGYLVCASSPAVLCQSYSYFTGVFVMV